MCAMICTNTLGASPPSILNADEMLSVTLFYPLREVHSKAPTMGVTFLRASSGSDGSFHVVFLCGRT